MRLKIKQLMCKHKWQYLSSNKIVNEKLFYCDKCNAYKVRHIGIMCEYISKEFPKNIGWSEIK